MNNRPYVTGGVEGWNLCYQVLNAEHTYEILQRTDLEDWVRYPHYSLRVDGEWQDDQANTEGGLARLKERCHAMNRVWHRKNEERLAREHAAAEKIRTDEAHSKLANWAMF